METVFYPKNVKPNQRIMFLGEPLNIQRYDSPKYPKFLELWRKQHDFRWMPDRYDLSTDRTNYENMTDTERFVFTTNLRWQTLTDSVLSRSIHEIGKYVTNNELELCMNIWAAMEDIHSFSYTHILQNISKNPGEFFDSLIDNKDITERAHQVCHSYDKLLKPTENIKQQIFDAILATQVTEGCAFYTSFICSFYFGYRGQMEGNAKIVGEIARDENLHVSITQNIFKYWKEREEEGFQGILKDNEQKIYDFYGQTAENEKKWAEYLFSNGSLLGLNENILKMYIEWLVNNRLHSLGYKKIFDTKSNPVAGWSDSFFDSSKKQNAPQEVAIDQYLVDAANPEIKESEFAGFSL